MSNQPLDKHPLFNFTADCTRLGVPEKCGIGTDGDGNIVSFGPWQRGTFDPRVDIAGPGFLWANALTSFFLVIGSFFAMLRVFKKWHYKDAFPPSKGRWEMHYPSAEERQGMQKIFHKAFRTFLLATSDTQMLFNFAYGLNFFFIQKCTISAYHYAIVIEFGLISCANFVLTMAFVSEYWKAPITGVLRWIAILVIVSFLGVELNRQRTRIEYPEYQPPFSRKDSAILLPASCFLDSKFKDIYSGLDTLVREKVGYPMKSYQYWEFPLWIVIVIVLAFGLWGGIMQLMDDRGGKAKTYNVMKGSVVCFYKVVVLVLVAVVSLIAWLRIYFLKTWVDRSGWIKPGRVPNPENDWLENGQILPMLQLVMIGVFVFNEYELPFYSPTRKIPSPQSSTELDDLRSQSQASLPTDSEARSSRITISSRQSRPWDAD